MSHLLRRLLPSSETHCLLARDVLSLPTGFEVEGVDSLAIASTDEKGTEMLEAFALQNGFPDGWAGEMLSEGTQALVAFEEADNQVLAMGWTTTKPFHVEEIDATLDPGGGIYLFGDFVAPPHRGRKLQRLLVAERLARASSASHACTIIHPANVASLRSYESQGFVTASRFTRYQWLGRAWRRCRAAAGGSRTRFSLEGNETIVARAVNLE